MKTFFDSSAFAKRYIEEPGSDSVESICQNATDLALSIVCIPEIISAMNRRIREGSISQTQYRTIKTCLIKETADVIIINLLPEVVADAIFVLENNAVPAMDALHIACALQWNADLFVSSDNRQLNAAKNAKLLTEKV